jgi:hypothetical protein
MAAAAQPINSAGQPVPPDEPHPIEIVACSLFGQPRDRLLRKRAPGFTRRAPPTSRTSAVTVSHSVLRAVREDARKAPPRAPLRTCRRSPQINIVTEEFGGLLGPHRVRSPPTSSTSASTSSPSATTAAAACSSTAGSGCLWPPGRTLRHRPARRVAVMQAEPRIGERRR